jgi:hypothetical protein
MRVCFESNQLGPNYGEALSLWHSLCNTFTTFSYSTPQVNAFSTDFNALCIDNNAYSACVTAQEIYDDCSNSFSSDNVRLTSCFCQPRYLSLDYTCEFIGNTSCLGIPAITSNLQGYACPNFAAIIGTGIVSVLTSLKLGSH